MDLQRIGELGFEKISLWYMLVLVLSFSLWWNLFVVFLSLMVFLLSTSKFAFGIRAPIVTYIIYAADIFYSLEVVFTTSYLRNKRLRKLRYTNYRHWVLNLIDALSLIPVELLFTFHYISDEKNPIVSGILSQNKSLRIYRLFILEWYYLDTIRTHWKYVFFTFILFFIKTLIVGHLFTCIWYNLKKESTCSGENLDCYLWYEVNMLNVILLNWSGPDLMFKKTQERILVTCAIFAGFFLIHTYIYPYTFYFSLLTGCKNSIFIEKHKRLSIYLRNMIQKGDLRNKIIHHFNYIWSEGETDEELENLLQDIPLALRKEIFTDIYWDAFRHSDLLRGTSRSFRRNLSLKMTTEYHYDGEVVYYKGQDKRKMIFLVQGVLQVMAEENEESPIMSFSSGTVFGELSLFLLTTSQALLKCKGSCELQILPYHGIFLALRDHPKDRKLVFGKFHERILIAKHTQWRKKRFKEDQKLEMLSTSYFTIIDCVKWLKGQWRSTWEGHQRHLAVLKARAEGTRLSSWRQPVRPHIKIEFVSNYLDMVVLSNTLEEKKGVVCLQGKFPWSIDPATQFLVIWKYTILVTSLIPAFIYPVCTSWFDKFPVSVYMISYVVTLLYNVDVGLKLITAVRTKHGTITKPSEIVRGNLRQVTFYLDIIAALPYQIIILFKWNVYVDESYKIGLALHPAIVKSYVFFVIEAPLGNYVDVITLVKNVIIFLLLLYWLAEIIQLYSIRNIFHKDNSWISRYMPSHNNSEFLRQNFLSVFRAMVVSISVPSNSIFAEDKLYLILTCLARYMFFVFSCFFMGSYFSSIVVKRFGSDSFQILVTRLKKFLASKNVPEEITIRILRSIRFQWRYNRADYIMSDVPLLNSMPYNIRRQVHFQTTYKVLQSNSLFDGESVEYLLEVLENSDLVAVPPGLVVVTYGHTSHIIYIIHRGYCQLNSHLEKDIQSNLGRPIILGPGYVFPLLSSFCCIPSPISVVTITDCELIVVDQEKLITVMMKYDLFKDIVDVIKETQLSKKLMESRPALMRICAQGAPIDEADYDFRNYGGCRLFCLNCWRGCYNFVTGFIRYWCYLYAIYLLIDCILWPCCFGLLTLQNYIVIPVLTAAKVLDLSSSFIHMFIPFYNKKGLMVTHPARTSVNYFSRKLIFDFLHQLPIFPIYYYGFANPYEKPNMWLTLVIALQHMLGMIYVLGCIGFIGNYLHNTQITSKLGMVLFFSVSVNLYVNMTMFTYSNWKYGGRYRVVAFELDPVVKPTENNFLRENNAWDYYVYMSYWVLSTMTTNLFRFVIPTGGFLYLTYCNSIVGTIINYFMFVMVSSSSKFADMGGTTFLEEFNTLQRFLKFEKSEDRNLERMKHYYKYIYSKTRGEAIKEIFGRLPLYLLEELWYPLYRPTFVKNGVFEDAEEGFFRILSTHVSSEIFTRGSFIIFRNQIQSDIYFLHRGKCFVYDWFMILEIGSIVGDLHQIGLMTNRVYALTHVEMLKISSTDFYSILNSFGSLEARFFHEVKRSENFIKSDVYREYKPIRPVDSRDAVIAFGLKKREIGFEDESLFEDPENSMSESLHLMKYKKTERRHCIIYPDSWFMWVYTYVSASDILLTIFSIPIFTMIGCLSTTALIIFCVLDVVWLVMLGLTFVVGVVDEEKGDVITNHKYLARNYLKNAFVFDVLGVIPFEMLPVAFAKSFTGANISAVLVLRCVRYLRVFSFYKFRDLEFGLVKSEFAKKCCAAIIFFSWLLVTLSSIFVRITENEMIKSSMDNFNISTEQLKAALEAFLYVLNFVASANIPSITATTRLEVIHFNFSTLIMMFIKGLLINSILSLMHFRNWPTFHFKTRVTKMESFLQKRETSPILIKSAVSYQTNLFRFTRSGAMSSLLANVPTTLRIPLMKDLFIKHVANFPLFEGLDAQFLDQLIARAKREVYFPGEKIVEQGDVDHRLYFIHTGEVYVISQTKERAYVEYVVGRMYAGEFFGEAQGLWIVKPHPYTYRGRTLVEVVVLHSDDWMDLRKAFPKITIQIYEKAKALRFI